MRARLRGRGRRLAPFCVVAGDGRAWASVRLARKAREEQEFAPQLTRNNEYIFGPSPRAGAAQRALRTAPDGRRAGGGDGRERSG